MKLDVAQVISEAQISDKRSNLATVMTRVLGKVPEQDGPTVYNWDT